MDLRFFHRLGATLLDRKPLCGGIRAEAWAGTFGTVPGMRPEQAEHARLIVAWGNNVTWSNLHLMPVIKRARKRGAKLVVVDPRRTPIAGRRICTRGCGRAPTSCSRGRWPPSWSGAARFDRDFIARHVAGFEDFMTLARRWDVDAAARICGVPATQVRTLVEWYATLSPAAISVGNGLERNQNGGSGIRAVLALPALAGKFGVRGGGLINGAGYAFPKTPRRCSGRTSCRRARAPQHHRRRRAPARSALSPPIKALFIYNHNPVVVHPDQNRLRRGLLRDDLFIVGSDVAMTDSMRYADIVLPASTHFEHPDLYAAYGTHWLQRADRVIAPQGESLPNTEIFRRLAARFGFTDPIFTATDAAADGRGARPGGRAARRSAAEPRSRRTARSR